MDSRCEGQIAQGHEVFFQRTRTPMIGVYCFQACSISRTLRTTGKDPTTTLSLARDYNIDAISINVSRPTAQGTIVVKELHFAAELRLMPLETVFFFQTSGTKDISCTTFQEVRNDFMSVKRMRLWHAVRCRTISRHNFSVFLVQPHDLSGTVSCLRHLPLSR